MIQILRETHDTPQEISRVLVVAGGLNRYGEPNYRAVWGWSRLDWIGGKWEDRDGQGALIREVVELRHEPKYFPLNRWHIERWMPPESYGSPFVWEMQTCETVDGRRIPALGPYPYRGDYEHSFTVEDADGNFVQLTLGIARQIARAIEFSRHVSSVKKKEAIDDQVRREEREYESFADSVMNTGSTITGPQVSVL